LVNKLISKNQFYTLCFLGGVFLAVTGLEALYADLGEILFFDQIIEGDISI